MINHSAPRSQRPGAGENYTRKTLSQAIRDHAPKVSRSKADKTASAAIARQQAGLREDPLEWSLYELGARVLWLHGPDPTGSSAVHNLAQGGDGR